jgi:hypothetical protein
MDKVRKVSIYHNHIDSKESRNFELVKLQRKHYILDIKTIDRNGVSWLHDLCTLENRKGWQHQLSKEANLQRKLLC